METTAPGRTRKAVVSLGVAAHSQLLSAEPVCDRAMVPVCDQAGCSVVVGQVSQRGVRSFCTAVARLTNAR